LLKRNRKYKAGVRHRQTADVWRNPIQIVLSWLADHYAKLLVTEPFLCRNEHHAGPSAGIVATFAPSSNARPRACAAAKQSGDRWLSSAASNRSALVSVRRSMLAAPRTSVSSSTARSTLSAWAILRNFLDTQSLRTVYHKLDSIRSATDRASQQSRQ